METGISSVGLDEATGVSLVALVWQADLVVKLVLLVLLLASLWCWAVIVDKTVRFSRLRGKVNAFEKDFWSGIPLDDLYRRHIKRIDHPMILMFAAAMEEWREAPSGMSSESAGHLITRIGRVMRLTMDREVALLEKNVPTLATIGSVAPFIGLFGTVWGIMNSFQSIALTETTTLAVVAPGIAEALFATAVGLFAAIPAVIAYNRLSRTVDDLADRFGSFADEFQIVASREIDQQRLAA